MAACFSRRAHYVVAGAALLQRPPQHVDMPSVSR
eukprot:CAMPEP_0177765034 /NCGR_PEP_ID=MMETSP0491_2-20121128/7772_1 /TAXON_ID=63592 /ORGANISM="Tetraselmis chuii, Strain PLY429" /LENGTH=33 /DNA_ID= /DNA_START= /DNA_END= /DNA_ORIENTATION=